MSHYLTDISVDVPSRRHGLAHIHGRLIRVLPADKVMLQVSPYDLSKRRVIYRQR